MNYFQIAEKVAREAGKILLDNLGKVKKIEYKAKKNLITEVDIESENHIIDIIKSTCPQHSILAEESGRYATSSDHLWIIDPLDGTTNYAHSYPFFAVSIALEIQGKIKLGIVYDPVKDELFSAEDNEGAFMNGGGIGVSDTKFVEDSLVCTGFIHEREWMIDENLRHFENFIRKSRAVRRDGSAALDLCYVACGRCDGFWELGLNPWDTAAGYLIMKEAGGKVTDFSGSLYSIYEKEILASNGSIHEEMIEILASGRAEYGKNYNKSNLRGT